MREIWVIKLNLPIFVTIQNRCGLWRNKNSDPSLLVLTPSLLIMGVRLLSVYTITPDSFTLAIRGMKPQHVFPLQNITEIEKEYTKSGKLKSIVIRYRKEGMYHNFLVIKKDDVNIEGILNAILNYCPSVSVR